MKTYFILYFFTLISIACTAQSATPALPVNPAGYYSLDSKITMKDGDTYGYFGTLKIKQVDSSRIYVDLYVCKGAPSYNSGILQDTLLYKNGVAVHTTTDDNTCVITFNFNTTGGVTVEEKTQDTVSGCGFGHAVLVNGYYKRIIGQ